MVVKSQQSIIELQTRSGQPPTGHLPPRPVLLPPPPVVPQQYPSVQRQLVPLRPPPVSTWGPRGGGAPRGRGPPPASKPPPAMGGPDPFSGETEPPPPGATDDSEEVDTFGASRARAPSPRHRGSRGIPPRHFLVQRFILLFISLAYTFQQVFEYRPESRYW